MSDRSESEKSDSNSNGRRRERGSKVLEGNDFQRIGWQQNGSSFRSDASVSDAEGRDSFYGMNGGVKKANGRSDKSETEQSGTERESEKSENEKQVQDTVAEKTEETPNTTPRNELGQVSTNLRLFF